MKTKQKKIAHVSPLILEYAINLVCWPYFQIIENLSKIGNKKIFVNSQSSFLIKQTNVLGLVTEGEVLCGDIWAKLKILIFVHLKLHSSKIFINEKSSFMLYLKSCLLTLASIDKKSG